MNYFLQAQSLANILKCLCFLFANKSSYGPEIQAKIDQIQAAVNAYVTELEQTLAQNNIETNAEGNPEDPCAHATYMSQLVNLMWYHQLEIGNSEPGGGGEPSGEPGEVVDNFGTILNLYGAITNSLEGNPCGSLEPFDANLKLNVPCVCRMLGLLNKINDSEINGQIQILMDLFENLKSVVEARSASILDPIEWPNDVCEQVDLLAKLLCLISTREDLVDEELITAFNDFVDQIEVVKSMLASIGIYPCENEIELGSDKLYIQAAGSTGIDGSVSGVHLRWTFMNDLAEHHLPKGNYSIPSSTYATTIGYNKANDFVRIFKFPYNDSTEAKICVDLTNIDFADIKETATLLDATWTIDYKMNGGVEKVRIYFADGTMYGNLKSSPGATPHSVVNGYGETVEISLGNRALFAAEYHFSNASGSDNQYEAISEYSNIGVSDRIVSTRLKDPDTSPSSFVKRIVNESIVLLKIKRNASTLDMICLESYQAFYYKNAHLINYINQYALTTNPSTAFTRLEDSSRFTVDKQWPSFNNGVVIKKASYEAKWTEPLEGLEHTVKAYLDKSKTDQRAIHAIPSDDTGDSSTFEISYLDALNIAASDYHFARMLGLGEIDETVNTGDSFIYMAEYKMRIPGTNESIPLLYFTLPTSPTDFRLPDIPTLLPIEYGFTPRNDDSDSLVKIDSAGYAALEDIRFVRLNKEEYPYENPGLGFFDNSVEFDTGLISKALRFGVEYKNVNDVNFVKPEITVDTDSPYKNYDLNAQDDINENDPVVESDNSLYIHAETSEGVHSYALYGINWFNRVSDHSTLKNTNDTIFPPRHSLIPPSKTNILLLQSDLPEMVVTAAEKTAYADKLRVKFDWNHLHNIAYPKANKIEFFHRTVDPMEIKGKIATVTTIGNGEKFTLTTSKYVRNSVTPAVDVFPTIDAGTESAYIGGELVVEGKTYIISDIVSTGDTPVIEIEGEEVITKSFDPIEPKKVNLTRSYVGPNINTFFTASENINDVSNWSQLDKTIEIMHFQPPYTETETTPGNQTRVIEIGGITGNATVTKADPSSPESKLYVIEIPSKILLPHPQESSENVFWNGGVARFKISGEIVQLRVVQIIQEAPDPLMFSVWNDTATVLPSSVDVNFHPSYHVYIDKEITTGFDDTNLLPLGNNEERISYFSLRSIDDTETPTLTSNMARPLDLKTHRVYEPEAPLVPQGSTYATRPDTFGKSTYSFDAEVVTTPTRKPYGLIFLRANEDSILNALYTPNTIIGIKDELGSENDDFHSNRFSELVNSILETGTKQFNKIPNTDSGYRFPDPDNIGDISSLTRAQLINLLKVKTEAAFVPLTKEPVLYSQIKTGYQTEDIDPVLRDSKGKLLLKSDADYHPYPMVRKYQDTGTTKWNVRFTDYTLDGAADNEYYYFSREIDPHYRFGVASPIKGPILLVNSNPPVKPEVVGSKTLLADAQLSLDTRFEIEIAPYSDEPRVERIRIYRTDDSTKAGNIILMDMIEEISFSTTIVDDFSDLSSLPVGDTMYYRLVCLRRITNEQSDIEYVPSVPSDVVEVTLIDEVNPNAPEIEATFDLGSGTLDNVHLKWNKTVQNGTYYLFKMNSSGTWQKIKEITSNNASFDVDLVDTALQSSSLSAEDTDGNTLYHRFKIDVENSSGLMNLGEHVLIISKDSAGISSNGSNGMAIGSTFTVS